MRQEAPVETVTDSEQAADVGRSNAFETAPVPGVVRDAEQGGQEKRIEKLFAELPITNPGNAFRIRLKR